MLHAMGVSLHIQGEPQSGPLLWVSNHIAWLDILCLHAVRQCRFVAKSEVHQWPIIGTLAAGAGTLFIERASRRDAMRVVHDMARALEQGDTLAVFPEGTTGLGDTVLPFHANLLQAAVATDSPIQPVLIKYQNAQGHPATHVRYVGQDTLLASIWRVLTAPSTAVHLQFLPLQHSQNRDRRAWSEDLRRALLDALK
jgi:1-acyl-sn-glycerol-3-phosphate acyltransferase